MPGRSAAVAEWLGRGRRRCCAVSVRSAVSAVSAARVRACGSWARPAARHDRVADDPARALEDVAPSEPSAVSACRCLSASPSKSMPALYRTPESQPLGGSRSPKCRPIVMLTRTEHDPTRLCWRPARTPATRRRTHVRVPANSAFARERRRHGNEQMSRMCRRLPAHALLRFVRLDTDDSGRPRACSAYESDSAGVLAGGTG